MSKDIVMLAKYWKDVPEAKKKDMFPMVMTEKLDGVMANIYHDGKNWQIRSRQNKPIHCAKHITDWFENQIDFDTRIQYTGELWCDLGIVDPDEHFNTLSGMIRKKDNIPNLRIYLFDSFTEYTLEEEDYDGRYSRCIQLEIVAARDDNHSIITVNDIATIDNEDVLLGVYNEFMQENPQAEGVVLRPLYGEISHYKTGRSWGFLKMIPDNSIDVPIEEIVEAVDKHNKPTGIAGGVIIKYKDNYHTVGLGSINHIERKEMWDNPAKYLGKIVEIAYKNETYLGALRMPRVKAIRWDK